MTPDHNQYDEALDKVLATLRNATPPEGMEARIAQRLQHAPATPATASRWLRTPAASTLSESWWRGALTGAAAATLAFGLFFVASHLMRIRTDRVPTAKVNSAPAIPAAVPVSASTTNQPARETRATPCAIPAVLQTHTRPVPSDDRLRAESFAPSHPAPALPPTAEERRLLMLARTADPKQLATLEASQETDEFAKFFAPPPSPQTPDTNAQLNPEPNQ